MFPARLTFLEWARLVDKAQNVEEHARSLMEKRLQHPLSRLDARLFLAFLAYCRETLHLPFDLLAFQTNDFEFIVILQRC